MNSPLLSRAIIISKQPIQDEEDSEEEAGEDDVQADVKSRAPSEIRTAGFSLERGNFSCDFYEQRENNTENNIVLKQPNLSHSTLVAQGRKQSAQLGQLTLRVKRQPSRVHSLLGKELGPSFLTTLLQKQPARQQAPQEKTWSRSAQTKQSLCSRCLFWQGVLNLQMNWLLQFVAEDGEEDVDEVYAKNAKYQLQAAEMPHLLFISNMRNQPITQIYPLNQCRAAIERQEHSMHHSSFSGPTASRGCLLTLIFYSPERSQQSSSTSSQMMPPKTITRAIHMYRFVAWLKQQIEQRIVRILRVVEMRGNMCCLKFSTTKQMLTCPSTVSSPTRKMSQTIYWCSRQNSSEGIRVPDTMRMSRLSTIVTKLTEKIMLPGEGWYVTLLQA